MTSTKTDDFRKCVHCHQVISYAEFRIGYCSASPNSFHYVQPKADSHLGGVGGE